MNASNLLLSTFFSIPCDARNESAEYEMRMLSGHQLPMFGACMLGLCYQTPGMQEQCGKLLPINVDG